MSNIIYYYSNYSYGTAKNVTKTNNYYVLDIDSLGITVPSEKKFTSYFTDDGGTQKFETYWKNWSFKIWNENSTGSGTNYAVGAQITGNHSLYAIWNSTKEKLQFPKPKVSTRVGYTFANWGNSSWVYPNKFTPRYESYSSAHYYAVYKANTHTLTFEGNGGQISNGSSLADSFTTTATYDSAYNNGGWVTSTYRKGYEYLYMSTSANGAKLDPSTIYTTDADSTIYAIWSAKSYTVNFNANGGSVSTASKSVTYDSTYGELPTPTREGYTFNGWYTNTSGGTKIESSTTVAITAEQTLFAQWTANTYTVTFDARGGSPAPGSITVTYDSTYGELPVVTRNCFTFNGWFTASEGGKQITSSSKVTITSNQTLYAQWAFISPMYVYKNGKWVDMPLTDTGIRVRTLNGEWKDINLDKLYVWHSDENKWINITDIE